MSLDFIHDVVDWVKGKWLKSSRKVSIFPACECVLDWELIQTIKIVMPLILLKLRSLGFYFICVRALNFGNANNTNSI